MFVWTKKKSKNVSSLDKIWRNPNWKIMQISKVSSGGGGEGEFSFGNILKIWINNDFQGA